jgi:hypothetical protein
MECSACLASCNGDCSMCKGLCGSGKSKKVCLTKKEFVGEHKHLIGLLKTVGKEGEKQAKELPAIGSGHPIAKKGMSIEQVLLWHFDMGHTLEDLKTFENGPFVIFDLYWQPTKQMLDKLNPQFQTFKFDMDGTLSAWRGRKFARDSEVLLHMLKKYESNAI